MKICAITERTDNSVINSISADVNDINIAYLLGAREHFSLGERNLDNLQSYDVFFIKMSKVRMPYEKTWMELVHLIKDKWPTKKILVYQEAEVNWPLRRNKEYIEQLELYKALMRCDLFLAHNQLDAGFYSGFCPAIYCPTPMPLERIKESIRTTDYRRRHKKIIFGSTFDDRANGLFGLIAARKATFDMKDTKLVQYTRSVYNDDRNEQFRNLFKPNEFDVIPRLGWYDYCDALSEAYISMSLMPEAAAGRDTIVFATLGIPHIGNYRLSTMQECFPKLCVEPLDVDKAAQLLRQLLVYNDMYAEIASYAQKAVEKHSFNNVQDYLKLEILKKIGLNL
jgi:hypothetical protein